MNLDPGVCFHVGEGYHLKVAVTFPNADDKVLVFGLTDEENIEERLCVFNKGEHPFFTKPRTAVCYRRACLLPYSGFNDAALKFPPRFKIAQLLRIVEAAHKSEELMPRYLRMLPKPGKEVSEYVAKITYLQPKAEAST